jgi:preprotein translocase subunit SecF
MEESLEKKLGEKKTLYERHYKKMTAISLSVLIVFAIIIILHYAESGELFKKDISLTGGTVITLNGEYAKGTLEAELKKYTDSYVVKYARDTYSGKVIATIAEAKIDEQKAKEIVDALNASDYSIETTSSSLGKNFFRQLMLALIVAFVFMALVVFVIFRTFIPSMAVILAAFTDIVGAIAIIDLLGISIGTGGIAALLMLIGYSVDTDIMLTTRVLKRRTSPLSERVIGALKTGLMMSGTAIVATFLAYIFSTSSVLKEIFLILSIGVAVDIFSTWVGNAGIITWYVKKKYGE